MSNALFDILDSASDKWWGKLSIRGASTRETFLNLNSVIETHFQKYSTPTHPCRETIGCALELLNGRSAVILETGTAAYGTRSTILFDSYVSSFGGEVLTVDNRITPLVKTRDYCSDRTKFHCDDSVKFIKSLCETGTKVDLIYLDSWDLDLRSPMDSAIHGLAEFLACVPMVQEGTVLLIDDTPSSLADWVQAHGDGQAQLYEKALEIYECHPGKGTLVKQYLDSRSIGKQYMHKYQLLWRL